MKQLVFKTQINATPEKVWDVLFTQDSYRKWSSAMNEERTLKAIGRKERL